jgi:hypothetical protein
LVQAVSRLATGSQSRTDLRHALDRLLSDEEIAALEARMQGIVAEPVYPSPGPGRNIPWPVMV